MGTLPPTRPVTLCCLPPGSVISALISARPGPSGPGRPGLRCSARPGAWSPRRGSSSGKWPSTSSATGPGPARAGPRPSPFSARPCLVRRCRCRRPPPTVSALPAGARGWPPWPPPSCCLRRPGDGLLLVRVLVLGRRGRADAHPVEARDRRERGRGEGRGVVLEVLRLPRLVRWHLDVRVGGQHRVHLPGQSRIDLGFPVLVAELLPGGAARVPDHLRCLRGRLGRLRLRLGRRFVCRLVGRRLCLGGGCVGGF